MGFYCIKHTLYNHFLNTTVQVFGSSCMFHWKSINNHQHFSKITIRCSLEFSYILQSCTSITWYMRVISLKQPRITPVSRSLEHTWLYHGFYLKYLIVSLKKNLWAAWILSRTHSQCFCFSVSDCSQETCQNEMQLSRA